MFTISDEPITGKGSMKDTLIAVGLGILFALVISLSVVGLAYTITKPAAAQACYPEAGVRAHLKQEYGEVPVEEETDREGNVGILFANPETGAWTFMVRPAQNPAVLCALRHGEGFQPTPQVPEQAV